MVSGAANPLGPAADSTKSDAKCWLPELDAPRISLDLSSLTQPDFSADTAAANSSAAIDSASSSHATHQTDSSTSKARSIDPAAGSEHGPANQSESNANLYAGLSDYAGMVTNRTTPQSSTDGHAATQSPAVGSPVHSDSTGQQTQQLPTDPQCGSDEECPDPHTGSANGDNNTGHLGLMFDFHTNPEVDAISTSPLFAISEPTAAASSTSVDGSQPSSTPPSQSPRAADAAVGSQALAGTSDTEPISRKPRGRRASIAGMLMRRASKYAVATPSANIAAEDLPHSDADTNAHAAVAPSDPLPESPLPAAQQVSTKCAVASSSDASIANSHKNKVCDDPPLTAATHMSTDDEVPAHGSGDITTALADDVSSQSVGMDICNPQATAEKEDTTARNADPSTTATTNRGFEHNHHLQGEELAARQSHTSSEIEDLDTLPEPSARSRSVEKRSSRILSEISRKVNHVRQTTSMVLRRSVGSRLSMIPGKSLETLNHAALDRIGVSAPNQDHLASTREDPPEYSVDDREGSSLGPGIANSHQGATAATANVDNRTAVVDTGRADTMSGNSLDQAPVAESAVLDAVTTTAIVADADVAEYNSAAADPKSGASVEKGHKDSLDARVTFSRRFGMVRRGTNEAVRSGVSRMRNMFAAKKSVTA
ncbi:hypothetical protein H4R24_002665 [Coemansia sp. RSA 988]|nr:hypothetical protein H4R24_002665 [Coemansia sp. RSA 988]